MPELFWACSVQPSETLTEAEDGLKVVTAGGQCDVLLCLLLLFRALNGRLIHARVSSKARDRAARAENTGKH